MLFSTVSIYISLALAFVIGLPALWMLQRGLWPESFERKLTISATSVFKSFLAGLIPLGIITVVLTVLGQRLGPIPGLLVSAIALAWGFGGAAGIASLIGMRLWPASEPWRQTRNGGLALVCCALLPMVGWFFMLPLIAIIGMGVNVRSWLLRKSQPAASHAQMPAPVPVAMPPPLNVSARATVETV